MKCPNCSSEMFVTDENATSKSHVTFYRCSLCISEHVSSQAVIEPVTDGSTSYFETPSNTGRRYVMV